MVMALLYIERFRMNWGSSVREPGEVVRVFKELRLTVVY
jgi:hypothetical protein